jgi:hypothetical protein
MMRTAYLKLRSRKPAVTIPMRARAKTSTGIWNTAPQASAILT